MRHELVIDRVIDEADYIIRSYESGMINTVRSVSSMFNVSKSTVHRDFNVVLPTIDSVRFGKVRDILNNNWKMKHIRGGQSTRIKYRGFR